MVHELSLEQIKMKQKLRELQVMKRECQQLPVVKVTPAAGYSPMFSHSG